VVSGKINMALYELLIVAHTMRTIISHESKTSTMQFVNTIKLINI
jgi:hypothetical protein